MVSFASFTGVFCVFFGVFLVPFWAIGVFLVSFWTIEGVFLAFFFSEKDGVFLASWLKRDGI